MKEFLHFKWIISMGFYSKNKQHVLIATSFVIFMTSLDAGILNVILPTIAYDFSISISLAQYCISSYLFAIIILVVPMGYMGSFWGKEIIYMGGICIFLLGCIFAYISCSFGALILARLLQGTGASMILSSNQAILVASCKDSIEKRYALCINTAAVTLGTLLGPVLGGFLIVNISTWQQIFLLFLIPGLIGFVLSLVYMDFLKIVLIRFIYILSMIASLIIIHILVVLFHVEKYMIYCYCIAIIMLGVNSFFKIRHQFFLKNVICCKKRSIFLMFFSYVVLFANNLSVSSYLSFSKTSPVDIGFMLSIAPFMVMLSSLFAKRFIVNFSEHDIIKFGEFLLIIACCLSACCNENRLCLMVSQCIIGLAIGIITPSISSLLYISVDIKYYSLIGSISSLSRNIGKMIGAIYPAILLSFNFSPYIFMFIGYMFFALVFFALVRSW